MVADHIFLKLDGFETQTDLMKHRTLLESIMIKYIIKGKTTLPLDIILKEACIETDPKTLGRYIQAVAQNTVIFISHQELYNILHIDKTRDLDLTLDCDPFFINKWAKSIGLPGVYSFNHIPDNKLKPMLSELEENIKKMKKLLEK